MIAVYEVLVDGHHGYSTISPVISTGGERETERREGRRYIDERGERERGVSDSLPPSPLSRLSHICTPNCGAALVSDDVSLHMQSPLDAILIEIVGHVVRYARLVAMTQGAV
jgi:hypothetical protein